MTEDASLLLRVDRDRATLWALAAVAVDQEAVPGDVPVIFRHQPRPVEARHRVAYRLALLALVLSHFNQGAARLTSLHVVMWATRTDKTRRIFAAWWHGRRFANTLTDRLDPDLNVTLSLALVDGLVITGSNGRIRLTEPGLALVHLIDADNTLMALEKIFLSSLHPLSDASIDRNLAGGR